MWTTKCYEEYELRIEEYELRMLPYVRPQALAVIAINEPPRGKTNNVVSEKVRHKPACTSTEKR